MFSKDHIPPDNTMTFDSIFSFRSIRQPTIEDNVDEPHNVDEPQDKKPKINPEDYSEKNIKNIEELLGTILDVKTKMNAVYQETSTILKNKLDAIEWLEEVKEEPSETKKKLASPTGEIVRKWTVRHTEPGPELTELAPGSGIYVFREEFYRCKLNAKDMRKFARALLPLVFSDKAFLKCSYSGKCLKGRPGLDDHARNIFMDFVTDFAEDSNWDVVSRKLMTQAMNSKIKELKHYLKMQLFLKQLNESRARASKESGA